MATKRDVLIEAEIAKAVELALAQYETKLAQRELDHTMAFVRYIETACFVDPAGTVTIENGQYFSFRSTDRVYVKTKTAGIDRRYVSQIWTAMWKHAFGQKAVAREIEGQLQLARDARLVRTSEIRGINPKTGEEQSFGLKYWSLENAGYKAFSKDRPSSSRNAQIVF